MALGNKKLKLILPPLQLSSTTGQKSNILAAIATLKDELDQSGSSDSESEDNNEGSDSSSGKEDERDEEEDNKDEDEEHKPAEIPTPPATVTKKQKHMSKKGVYGSHLYPPFFNLLLLALIEPENKITYILAIFSKSEAKKAVSKRVPKTKSLQLSTDEPWDTMKAQVLVQISAALNPSVLDFENYEIMFHIPRVLPKPGLSLASETDYLIMTGRGRNMTAKHPTINISVVAKLVDGEKENEMEEADQEKSKEKGKKVCASRANFYIS